MNHQHYLAISLAACSSLAAHAVSAPQESEFFPVERGAMQIT